MLPSDPDRPAPLVHFAVDDVFAALLHASDTRRALFEHPCFAALAALHAEFGIDVDLYVFLEGEVDGRRRSLAELCDHVRDDLARSPWLRLGPHGLDYAHPPYQSPPEAQRDVFDTIYREIDRLVGPERRSSAVRLHCFSESFALAEYWRAHGVDTLLLTDREAVAYHLPDGARRELAERGSIRYGGLTARRTHERIENLAAAALGDDALRARLAGHVARHRQLVLSTHEVDLGRPEVSATAARCLRFARERGLLPA